MPIFISGEPFRCFLHHPFFHDPRRKQADWALGKLVPLSLFHGIILIIQKLIAENVFSPVIYVTGENLTHDRRNFSKNRPFRSHKLLHDRALAPSKCRPPSPKKSLKFLKLTTSLWGLSPQIHTILLRSFFVLRSTKPWHSSFRPQLLPVPSDVADAEIR